MDIAASPAEAPTELRRRRGSTWSDAASSIVETAPAEASLLDLREKALDWIHSRVVVIEGNNVDHVVGVLLRRDAMNALVRNDDTATIGDLTKPARYVHGTMPAHELLDQFIAHRQHLVVVVDEYGGFQGVVTLEDVLEELLGAEIVDEFDDVEDKQAHARQLASVL